MFTYCVCVCAHVCRHMTLMGMEVKGHLPRVHFLLPLYEPWGSDSSHQAWQQAAVHTEPPLCPQLCCCQIWWWRWGRTAPTLLEHFKIQPLFLLPCPDLRNTPVVCSATSLQWTGKAGASDFLSSLSVVRFEHRWPVSHLQEVASFQTLWEANATVVPFLLLSA